MNDKPPSDAQAPTPQTASLDLSPTTEITPISTTNGVANDVKNPTDSKDAKWGCAILLGLCIFVVLLWFQWRPIIRVSAFLIPCAFLLWVAGAVTNGKWALIVLSLFVGLFGYISMDKLIGVFDRHNIKSPPEVIEKIARNELSPYDVEYVKVEEGGGEMAGLYTVNISYHQKFLMTSKGTLDEIQLHMDRAYREILRHKELPLSYLKINVQLEMHDNYGNENEWGDAYRTQIDLDTIKRINRDNLDSVQFENIWEVVWVHPSLSR